MQIAEEHRVIIDRIRDLRIERGLSQSQLAKLLGVSSGNVGSWETYKALPGAIALKNIALNLECSLDWLILGREKATTPVFNYQPRNELVFDADFKKMIDILKSLMYNENPHMRSWAIIQFENAFKEHCAAKETEKKLHA